MTLTATDLVKQTRDYVWAGRQPVVNEVAAPVAAGATQLTFARPVRGIATGQVLSVGWSDFYVWEYDSTNAMATVRPGWNDSPSAAIEPGALVLIGPRWTDWQLLNLLNTELRSLSGQGGLWERIVCYYQWDGAHRAFDLPFERNVDRVLSVEAESSRTWEWWQLNPSAYRFSGDAHADEYPSGQSLTLFDFSFLTAGRRMRIQGAAPLLELEPDSLDAAASVGLAQSALDVPVLGVASRVASLEEQRRNQLDAQGDARRSEQVPMSAWTATARDLRRLYEGRLAEERANLNAITPYRRGM